ncbi:MAG: hypothetical protein ACREPY_18330 [Rhodanobacteraceae bacterium]
MDNKDSNLNARPETDARERLTALLLVSELDGYHPPAAVTDALKTLEEFREAYFKGEALHNRKNAPTPARSRHAIENLLGHINRFEAFADGDTLTAARPSLTALRKVLEDRCDVFDAWQMARERNLKTDDGKPFRKTDVRTERMRPLCGHIAIVWRMAAYEPSNRTHRRRFAVAFLDDAGIEHPGTSHPEMLDDWLDAPVEPMTPELNAAAACDGRAFAKLG